MQDAAPSSRARRSVGAKLTRTFVKHYIEMVVVMLAGMALLAVPARRTTDALWSQVDGNDPTLMLARMGATMTLPMIPWMRWRGHRWQPTLEMAAAMVLPALGVIALSETQTITTVWLLMTLEHIVMLAAMFAVMIARPEEYSGTPAQSPTAAPR